MSDKSKKELTADRIKELMRVRYQPPEWALGFEVTVQNEMDNPRRADAVAMNVYRYRDYAIHGFEFKVSRSDWLGELKQPEKSEALMRHCDFWWLVAPRTIVYEEELPEKWGYIIASPNRLRQQRQAEPIGSSQRPMDRELVSSLVSKFIDFYTPQMTEEIDRRAKQQVRQLENDLKAKHTKAMRRLRFDLTLIERLEEVFGERWWNGENWGDGRNRDDQYIREIKAANELQKILSTGEGVYSRIQYAHEALTKATEALENLTKPEESK